MIEKMLDSYPEKVLERLKYLEMRLAFLGEVKRRHIAVRFGVKPATCTRDLALYNELNNEAMTYDLHSKCYRPSEEFNFIFKHNIEDIFSYLATGYISVEVADRGLITHTPMYSLPASNPDIGSCIAISQALYNNLMVNISYISRSSGETEKVIAPHSLFKFNSSWYVRGYDFSNQEFRTFNLSRIKSSKTLKQAPDDKAKAAHDLAFKNDIQVSLIPHPSIRHKKAIEIEYGMANGSVSIEIKEGMLGYLMQQWRVDCSINHSLNPNQFPLALLKPRDYEFVDSFIIAPK